MDLHQAVQIVPSARERIEGPILPSKNAVPEKLAAPPRAGARTHTLPDTQAFSESILACEFPRDRFSVRVKDPLPTISVRPLLSLKTPAPPGIPALYFRIFLHAKFERHRLKVR